MKKEANKVMLDFTNRNQTMLLLIIIKILLLFIN